MAVAERSVVHPEPTVWNFGDRRYVQTELTIDGEIKLLQLVGRTVQRIGEDEFPWSRLVDVFDEETETTNVPLAAELVTRALVYVPSFAVDSALILFGVFDVDENNKPNPEFDEHKAHLRKHIRVADWVELLVEFFEQNDYKRLIAPFAQVVKTAMRPYLEPLPTASEATSKDSPDSPKPDSAGPKKSRADTRIASSSTT